MVDGTDPLARLRSRTKPLHDALEQQVEGSSLLSNPTLQHYRHLLVTHWKHHLEVAQAMKQVCLKSEETILDWPNCHRIFRLTEDLRAIDADFPDTSAGRVTECTTAFAIGLCYVSEGSSIGNAMMYRQLSQDKRFQSWGASSFLASCNQGKRWPAFLAVLKRHLAEDYDQVEAGAIYGFYLFTELWQESTWAKEHGSETSGVGGLIAGA